MDTVNKVEHEPEKEMTYKEARQSIAKAVQDMRHQIRVLQSKVGRLIDIRKEARCELRE